MEKTEQSIPVVAVTAALGAVILLIFLVFNAFKSKQDEKTQTGEGDDNNHVRKQNEVKKSGAKKGSQPLKSSKKASTFVPFTHPWLAGTLKGHSGRILSFDFSMNGKYFVSSSDDRVVMLWSVKEFCKKDHKYIRTNVTYDCVNHVAFSPDSRAFVGSLEQESGIRVFRMTKREDGSSSLGISEAQTFPVKHDAEIIAMGIASNGRFLMTCGADTTINLWTPKGDHLASINTHQMQNSCGRLSPCGRFVGSSGFTPDVKVWEICFDKSENFKDVQRAFELKGHKAGVYSFDFSNDSTRMASVSKDGTWKLWNTDVQYQMSQDPKLLFSGTVTLPNPHHIALSPDGRTAAIASDNTIALWNGSASQPDAIFENVHPEEINGLAFDSLNRYMVSCGGRHIQVIHNVTGYKTNIKELEEKLREAKNASLEERLKKQINEKREALNEILSPSNSNGDTKAR